MLIRKIKVKNYRLLKSFSIDLETKLSLIIGKNNTGKTSLLTVMEKFINGSDNVKFSFDDFNIEFKQEIKTLLESPLPTEDEYLPIGIKLKLFIEYNEHDNLANISQVMMDLDPDNNFVLLSFEYLLNFASLERMKEHFIKFKENEAIKKNDNEEYIIKETFYFLKRFQVDYFQIFRKSIEYDYKTGLENNSTYIDLISEKISIKDIINFKYISAKSCLLYTSPSPRD